MTVVDVHTGEIAGPLTLAETQTLADCEQKIERGLASFVETGQALVTIRDGRMYRETYGTFEDYCQQRWSMNRDYANKLIVAARVEVILDTFVSKITREAQARELAPLLDEPEKLREVWSETVQRTGGKPTAAAVKQVREDFARPEPEPVITQADHDFWDATAAEARSNGVIDQMQSERPYALAVVAVSHAAEQITATTIAAADLGARVPESNRHRLDVIDAAHRWLGEFLAAAARQETHA